MVQNRVDEMQIPPSLLTLTAEQEKKVKSLLDETRQEASKTWWESDIETFYVPVRDGELRVFHWKPKNPISKRPIVFVPGWGIPPVCYNDFYEVLYNKAECYYIETREKGSSRMSSRRTRFDLSQKAKDVTEVLKFFGLTEDKDFILVAPCWGSAIILQGLLDGNVKAPTIIAVDPMHTLWFPKWVLKYLAPFLPPFIITLLKPFFKKGMLGDMKEPVQQKRAFAVLDDAVIWKWRKAAMHVQNYELFNFASEIKEEVIVLNGTEDKIHQQTDYPKIAMLMPKGRFLFMKTGEENRERLMGLVALKFSRISAADGIPPELLDFEKDLKRNNQ